MTIGLWTKTGIGSVFLTNYKKVEGCCSVVLDPRSTTDPLTLTRKYFACQSFRVEFYINLFRYNSNAFKVIASQYGAFAATTGMTSGYWDKRRVTFLWDPLTETKWYRQERWNGSTWDILHGDIDLGNEEPSNSTFAIKIDASTGYYSLYIDAMTCEVLA